MTKKLKTVHKPDLSSHRLSMFEVCPQKLRYYMEKWPSADDRGTIAMRKGSVSHKAIEIAAKARRKNPALPAIPTRDEIVECVDYASIRSGLTPDAHRDVREALADNVSVLNLGGQICDPEKREVVHMGREIYAEVRFDLVAAERMGSADPTPPEVDEPRRVVIRDWKAGEGQPATQAEAEAMPQIGLYLTAARALWPEAQAWEFHLVHVRHQTIVPVRWTEGLDAIWRARSIGSVKAWNAGYAPARPGEHCRNCGYRFVCQAWLEVMDVVGTEDRPAADMPDPVLLEERYRASLAERLGEKRRKDLDAEIRARTRDGSRLRGTTPSRGMDLEARVSTRMTPKIALEAAIDLAIMRDQDVLSLLQQAGGKISSRKMKALPVTPAEHAVVKRWTSEKKSWSVRVKEVKA